MHPMCRPRTCRTTAFMYHLGEAMPTHIADDVVLATGERLGEKRDRDGEGETTHTYPTRTYRKMDAFSEMAGCSAVMELRQSENP